MKLFVIFKCVIVFTQIFALPVEDNEIKPSDEVSFTENEDADEIENISRHKKSHPTICVEIKPSVNNEKPYVMCKNNYQSSNGYQNGYTPQNNYGNNGYQSRNYFTPVNRYNPQISNYAVPSGYQKSGYAQPNNYLYNGPSNHPQYFSPPAQHRPTEYRSSYGYDLPIIQNKPQSYSAYSQPPQYSQNYNTNSYKSPTCGSSLLVGCQPRVIPIGCNAPARPSYSSYAPQPVPTYYSELPQTYHPQYLNPQQVLPNDIKTIPQNYRSSSVNESSLSSTNTIQASNNVSSSTQKPQENDIKDDSKVTSMDKEKANLEQETLKKINEMKGRLAEANKEASSISSSNIIPGANAQGPQSSQQTSFYSQW